MAEGQINRGSLLGEKIYQLSKSPEVSTIVEIGTWNGAGSTKCIRDGIVDSGKTNYRVVSLEAYESMMRMAKENHQPLPNFDLVYGRVIDIEDVVQPFDPPLGTYNADEPKWWHDDCVNYGMCPNVINQIPSFIDLLVLDGGEFTTETEFAKLSSRSKYIIVDDTQYRKTKKIREQVLKSADYKVIEDQFNDRAGWMLFQNMKVHAS